MKEKADLVAGWLRKAQSDRVALDVTLRSASKRKMRSICDVEIAVPGLPPEVIFRAMAAVLLRQAFSGEL
jgi:hypothetical protein